LKLPSFTGAYGAAPIGAHPTSASRIRSSAASTLCRFIGPSEPAADFGPEKRPIKAPYRRDYDARLDRRRDPGFCQVLRHAIDDDPFPLSPRLLALNAILEARAELAGHWLVFS
jgi:hypothetical protein